jgi:predicted acylesterase/phospholipase RssA
MSNTPIDATGTPAGPLTPGAARNQTALMLEARALLDAEQWLGAFAAWRGACAEGVPQRTPNDDALCVAQQAHCWSKNKALSLEQRTEEALAMLRDPLSNNPDQETLGIAGGIHKRRWDAFHQFTDLRAAKKYYVSGWERGALDDDGYTAINAAYVIDLIAFDEFIAANGNDSAEASAKQTHEQAQAIRRQIVDGAFVLDARATERIASPLPETNKHPWWILVTLAEAHLGLAFDHPEHAGKTRKYLEAALEPTLPTVADWMLETTARQLARIARMQERLAERRTGSDAAWATLEPLLERVPAVRTELAGKVGLALSGGGFRASLFHIGVLARLAELDLLRHVEVLSCVSGGSILGAVYYLELRKLLMAKRDEQIRPADYIQLVKDIEREFLEKIQQNNFRLRMLERFTTNVQMLRNRGSRTESIGRVMGEEVYGGSGDDTSIYMDRIGIQPAGETNTFKREDHNWRRKNKVPLLVLNATNQETGHGWHFTPEQMGEPTTSKIDAIAARSRRAYAEKEAPELWRAVTASACVPVVFEPIQVKFGGELVNLLDGGVHDNQGSSALLDRDCTLMLVSDASGQLTRDANPSRMALAVGLRAENIEAARLREALYAGLEARKRGSLLRGVMFLHLRLELGESDTVPTPYGLTTGLQQRLSKIRTDLDVFHDVEAHALMLSGYLMTCHQLPKQLAENVPTEPVAEGAWTFRAHEQELRQPSRRIYDLLDASSAVSFKAWRVVPALRVLKWILGAVGLVAVAAVAYWAWHSSVAFTLRSIVEALIGAGLVFGAQKLLGVTFPNWKRDATFFALAFVGAGIAFAHKHWIDKKYLQAGRFSGNAQTR